MDLTEDPIVTGRKFYTLLVKNETGVFCGSTPVSAWFSGMDVVRCPRGTPIHMYFQRKDAENAEIAERSAAEWPR